jgi:putative tributyrin esterase
MALIHCNFFSEVLNVCTSMDVILPQQKKSKTWHKTGKHPVLFLLHGLSDDHTIWQRRTAIERYVEAMGLAVVMPAVGRSWYTDMAAGDRYWTYISEEVPARAREFFPLSEAREHNFVAGLSMGGYGAFKLALRCPRKFAAAASLSGALDLVNRIPTYDEDRQREMKNIFGDLSAFPGSLNDLFFLAHRLAKSGGPKPLLFQCCGTEDYLYPHNRRFRDHARNLSLPLCYEEGPGVHDWAFWDRWIQRVLQWLPLE